MLFVIRCTTQIWLMPPSWCASFFGRQTTLSLHTGTMSTLQDKEGINIAAEYFQEGFHSLEPDGWMKSKTSYFYNEKYRSWNLTPDFYEDT